LNFFYAIEDEIHCQLNMANPPHLHFLKEKGATAAGRKKAASSLRRPEGDNKR
jgi:hypothetical protein